MLDAAGEKGEYADIRQEYAGVTRLLGVCLSVCLSAFVLVGMQARALRGARGCVFSVSQSVYLLMQYLCARSNLYSELMHTHTCLLVGVYACFVCKYKFTYSCANAYT